MCSLIMAELVSMLSKQWSCSSFQSAAGFMDHPELLAELPDDPMELATLIQERSLYS